MPPRETPPDQLTVVNAETPVRTDATPAIESTVIDAKTADVSNLATRFVKLFAPRSSSAASTIRARDAASSARASTFEMAVTISSVKCSSRDSASSGNASKRRVCRASAPHKCPSTSTGTATETLMPALRSMVAIVPVTPVQSIRTARRVRAIRVAGSTSPIGQGSGQVGSSPDAAQLTTWVTVRSGP